MPSQPLSTLVAVVEDDSSCRIALGRLLRAGGFDAALFESAEAYISAPRVPGAACVIVDVHLPGMSGIGLQRHLRDEGVTTPIIVTTGAQEAGVRVRAEQNGCAGFFQKPVDSDALLATIASLTGQDLT